MHHAHRHRAAAVRQARSPTTLPCLLSPPPLSRVLAFVFAAAAAATALGALCDTSSASFVASTVGMGSKGIVVHTGLR